MRSTSVVPAQVAAECAGAQRARWVAARVRPFAQECLDEALGLAVYSNELEAGDWGCAVFVLATPKRRVAGYATFTDLTILSRETGEPRKYFYIPAFATDKRWRGTNVAAQLVRVAYGVLRLRLRSTTDPYHGVLCTTRTNPELYELLLRRGFVPFADDDFFMWRALPEGR